MKSIYHYDTDPDLAGLEALRRHRGMPSNFVKTHKRFLQDKDSFFNRFTKRGGKGTARWEDFLAHDGIKKHWRRDESGKPIVEKKRKWDEVE